MICIEKGVYIDIISIITTNVGINFCSSAG